MKVRFHYSYPIDLDIETDKEVDVYIDQFNPCPVPAGAIRIVIIEEPKKGEMFDLVQRYRDAYTYVLTFHEEILRTNPKAILFHCMTAWVKGYLCKKVFSVSTVVGGKKDPVMEGYKLRHDLWHSRNSIHIPKRFYLSGTAKYSHVFHPWKDVSYVNELVLGASKSVLFNSMFHIAIENTSIKNYFSEKLVDCFQSKTVPIYYGCANVEEFFNVDGILIAHDLNDIITICNRLNPVRYYEMMPEIEDNYERSKKWLDNQEQIKIMITKLINDV